MYTDSLFLTASDIGQHLSGPICATYEGNL